MEILTVAGCERATGIDLMESRGATGADAAPGDLVSPPATVAAATSGRTARPPQPVVNARTSNAARAWCLVRLTI
jgi:hypothetical protein